MNMEHCHTDTINSHYLKANMAHGQSFQFDLSVMQAYSKWISSMKHY